MTDSFSKEIALRLKMVRTLRGYYQSEVAEKVGVKQNYYAMWETGERTPSAHYLLRLSKTLGISISWLLAGEEPMEFDVRQHEFVKIHAPPERYLPIRGEIPGTSPLNDAESSKTTPVPSFIVNNENVYVLLAADDSMKKMKPPIERGNRIIVEPFSIEPSDKDLVVAVFDGVLALYIYWIDKLGDSYIASAMSDNMRFDDELRGQVKIKGRVVAIHKTPPLPNY